MKSGLTIESLAAEILRQKDAKEDYIVDTQFLQMDASGDDVVLRVLDENKDDQIEPLDIGEIAHRQIGTHLSIPAKYYAKMLAEKPVVLNSLYCYPLEPVEGTLAEDDCVKQYVVGGGTPIFVAKNELYTVSHGIDRQLIECVPKEAYGYYGFWFYGHNLSGDSSFKRDLTIHYHEDHQYLEVSALDDVSKCIDIVLEVCKKYGKQVVLPKE